MLDTWCHIENLPWPKNGTTAGLVHGLSLEWGVRAIVDLSTELEVQWKGFLKYQSKYQGHKLWWQQIKVYILVVVHDTIQHGYSGIHIMRDVISILNHGISSFVSPEVSNPWSMARALVSTQRPQSKELD